MLSYVPMGNKRACILIASALLLNVPAYAADVGGTDLECRVLFRVACAPDFCSQKSPTGGVVGSDVTFKYQTSDKSVKVCIANLCSMGTMTSDQQQAGSDIRVLTGSIEWQWFDRKDSDMRVIATGGLGHSGPSFLGTVVSHGEVDDIDTIGGDCR